MPACSARIDRDEAHTFGLFRDAGDRRTDLPLPRLRFGHEPVSKPVPSARTDARESERFGADHAVIGAVLARDWQLPEEMSDAILWHHADFVLGAGAPPIPDATPCG